MSEAFQIFVSKLVKNSKVEEYPEMESRVTCWFGIFQVIYQAEL